jgi:hypothetical protein
MCKLGVSLNSQEIDDTLVAHIIMPFIKCNISVFWMSYVVPPVCKQQVNRLK